MMGCFYVQLSSEPVRDSIVGINMVQMWSGSVEGAGLACRAAHQVKWEVYSSDFR